MSRRGILITVICLGVIFIALYFLRSNNQSADSVASVNSPDFAKVETNDSEAQSVNSDQEPSARPPASSLSETESSSSSPASGGPGRGARSANRPLSGKKSYNIRGAVAHDDALFSGTPWKVWSGVVGYPKAAGEPSGKVLGEVNGYYLVEDGSGSSSESFDPAKPFVVLREDTGTAGVVSGNFAVVIAEGASADFLTQSGQVKVVGAFPNIQTYYVTSSQSPFSLKALQDDLKQAPEVKDVKMEILDRQYEKF